MIPFLLWGRRKEITGSLSEYLTNYMEFEILSFIQKMFSCADSKCNDRILTPEASGFCKGHQLSG